MANLLAGFKAKKTVSVVEHHEVASKAAFSLFSDTLDKLVDSNTDIDIDISAAQAKIDETAAEKAALVAIRQKNSDLYNKINKFFGSK